MGGVHYLCDFKRCACDLFIMRDMGVAVDIIIDLIKKSGLTPLSVASHQFVDDSLNSDGFSFVVILQESHLGFNIHTWPEDRYENSCQMDLFVCNYIVDNSKKAKKLLEELIILLKPKVMNKIELIR